MRALLFVFVLFAVPLHAQKNYDHVEEFSFNEEAQGDCKIHYQGDPNEVLKFYPNLKKLEIFNCRLERIPPIIFTLKKLEYLNLSGNKISKIPEEIGNLTQLRWLNLAKNLIKELPDGIGKLVNLVTVGLEKNQLTELPESIGRLMNLENLDLSHNNLSEVPESIGRLMNLEELDLGSNQIEYLPKSIMHLKQLKLIVLSKNSTLERRRVPNFYAGSIRFSPDPTIVKTSYIKEQRVFGEKYTRQESIERIKAAIKGFENYRVKIIVIEYNNLARRLIQITAKPSLKIREHPSIDSAVLGSVPYKTKVLRYLETTYQDTIDNISSPWYKIEYIKGNNIYFGWVFGGYVEKVK